MFKTLSLVAALAVLPLSGAVAQDEPKLPSEARLEAAAEAFEARMEGFESRADAIKDDESLSETERSTRLAALTAEYQPEIDAFTRLAVQMAPAIAAEALAGIDLNAVIAEAMAEVDIDAVTREAMADIDVAAITEEAMAEVKASGVLDNAMAGASGMATNGAWASNDPEHMATYGLMADYALGEAMDEVGDIQIDLDDVDVDVDIDATVDAPATPQVDQD